MIVDDEPGLRTVLEIYLKDAGYNVTTASDGKKALTKLEATTFDIILTDIKMPGLDGISLLKLIKKTQDSCPKKELG